MAIYRGVVKKGKGEGRLLGYPTANIKASGIEPGIYAAKARLAGKEYLAAGFVDDSKTVLEAHILDFNADIYGEDLEVELLKKIRPNKKFYDVDALKQAIAEDIKNIQAFFI